MGAVAQPLSPPPSSPRLRRQRSLASSISICCCSCLCGRNSLFGYDFNELFSSRLPAGCKDGFSNSPQKVQQQQSGGAGHCSWRVLGRRRKCNMGDAGGSSNNSSTGAWSDEAVLRDDNYYKPPRWKLLVRKLRAETRKMNCCTKAPARPAFQYDALSYAMNFDEGCAWQQQQAEGLHTAPRCSSTGSMILMESSSLKVSAAPVS